MDCGRAVDSSRLERAYRVRGLPGEPGEWDHYRMAATHGRVALVTGSSRGLGAVIARRLARDGFAVAVNGRPGDEKVAAIGRAN